MKMICPTCKGTGTYLVDCPYCKHSEILELQKLEKPCLCCHNTGYFEDICPVCYGSGLQEKSEAV